MLVEQLAAIMPELREVGPWPIIGEAKEPKR